MGMCESKNDEQRRREESYRKKSRNMRIKPIREKSISMTEGEVKQAVISNFDKYDRNGDGTLDQQQLTQFFKDILRRKGSSKHDPEQLASKFIHMVDMDGDNRLTREEIYQFYKD